MVSTMKTLGGRFASLIAIGLGCTAGACETPSTSTPEVTQTTTEDISAPAATFASTYSRQWMLNMAFSAKFDLQDPLLASRAYAYGAIAAYEAVVHGMPGYQSLAGQINGLDSLPQPTPGLEYDWPTVLAATMGRVVPATYTFPNTLFFEYTTAPRVSLGSMERVQIARRAVQAGVPQTVIDNSVDFGHSLGDAIAAWANTDGFADIRYKNYQMPEGPDQWVQAGYINDQTTRPLLPHWGELRPIALMAAADCEAAPHIPFSTVPGSDFYNQANTVYQTDLALTKAQRETAFFWADGKGSETPPGHWVKITNDLIRPLTLADAVRAHLLVSATMFDAGIATWHTKYKFNLLRPETYIHRHIAAQWRTLIPTPQFPSYTSGHSGFSKAAAVSLTSVFGAIPFTDRTKVRGGFAAVSYSNFDAAADEAAASRLYGGIHYPMDNESGKTVGACAANAFLNRVSLTM